MSAVGAHEVGSPVSMSIAARFRRGTPPADTKSPPAYTVVPSTASAAT
jgi:hypothetical protein